MFLLAAISYGFSIFIDVAVYHLKFHVHDIKNLRYLFSLINVFQFSARAFVLIFIPMMAYYTETVKDMNLVWMITLYSHVFVILLLLPLLFKNFSYKFSIAVIMLLNRVLGKNRKIDLVENLKLENLQDLPKGGFISKILFSGSIFISGFLFSVGITFIYYLSFWYPEKSLTLVSYSQIINMIGSILLILFIDPKVMSSIDIGDGQKEIKILTRSRIFVHIFLIFLLFLIK
ncbi:lipid II flippase family protein [Flavobacterium sp. W22_SRS_FP1]|uniref:lipid II flippase family protein n=1 Tax=Flavobacterium sp. W22_SRS_FP1 TaxID=3240276 RepID=UPI003F9068B8